MRSIDVVKSNCDLRSGDHLVSTTKDTIMLFVFIGLLVLNFLDAVLTLYEVKSGIAIETVPLAKWFLNLGDHWFVVWKIVQVGSFATIAWFLRDKWLAKLALIVCFLVYAGLFCWHLWGLLWL